MKLNKYIGASAAALLMLAGCADNDFYNQNGWEEGLPEELNLQLNVADPELIQLGQTRGDDGPIAKATVLQYNGATCISVKEEIVTSDDDNYYINFKLDPNATQLQVVANHTVSDGCTNLATETVSTLPKASTLSTTNPILWGYVDLTDINRYQPSLTLYRQFAKVEVDNNADNFNFTGFSVVNVASSGTVAPSLGNWQADPKIPTMPTSVSYTEDGEDIAAGDEAYIFETKKEDEANQPKIIVKGKYNGASAETYYVVGFRTRSGSGASEIVGKYTYTPIDILRNHNYSVKIEQVRSEGFSSLEEAKKAEPDNRITVWVEDKTAEITDMIASRDYMLGVQEEVTVEYYEDAVFSVICSYPSAISNPLTITRENSADDWILTTPAPSAVVKSSSNANAGKTLKTLEVTVSLTPNDHSTEPKSGYVIVTAGDLSRRVKITQKGRDLRGEREATLYGLTSSPIENYFNWAKNICKGMKENENRGLARNEALIFSAVPTHDLYYIIPKRANDSYDVDKKATITEGSEYFTVTTEGNNWKVSTLKKYADNEDPILASGKLLIECGDGLTKIEYDLAQVGFFHEMEAEYQQYTRGKFEKGWYYYEVVKIGNYYILDRNLGASSNVSYDPSSILYSDEDKNAIGSHFTVSIEKANVDTKSNRFQDLTTIVETLGLKYDYVAEPAKKGKFCIPSENEFKNFGLPKNKKLGAGSVAIPVDEASKVKDGIIYFPAAGYYYNNLAKNQARVNVWTRTLLGGSQGLTEKDKEYGTQYRYLDIFGGVVGYANLRISAGSGGNINPNLRNYLPIRLVWRGNGQTLNAPEVPDADYSQTITEVTVYLHNEANWANVYAYVWDHSNGTSEFTGKYPGKKLTAVTYKGENNWYRIVIPVAYPNFIFDSDSDGNNGKLELHNFRKDHMNATVFEYTNKNGQLTLVGTTEVPVTPVDPDPIVDTNIKYYLHSDIEGDWGDKELTLVNGVATVTFDNVEKDKKFSFKAVDSNNNETTWYNANDNNDVTILPSDATYTLKIGGGKNFVIGSKGKYTFKFDPANKVLTVSAESTESNPKFYYQLHSGKDGSEWKSEDASNKSTAETDGNWTWTVRVEKDICFGIKRMRYSDNQQDAWISADGTTDIGGSGEFNCKVNGSNFKFTEAGEYTLTFTPENKLTVVKNGGGNETTLSDGYYLSYGSGDTWNSTWSTEKMNSQDKGNGNTEYSVSHNFNQGDRFCVLKVENKSVSVIQCPDDSVTISENNNNNASKPGQGKKTWKTGSSGNFTFYYKNYEWDGDYNKMYVAK